MAETLDRKNAPEPLKALARKLCGCEQNMQGGCPYPSMPCLERAIAHEKTTSFPCNDCDKNGQCTGDCLDNFVIGPPGSFRRSDDA